MLTLKVLGRRFKELPAGKTPQALELHAWQKDERALEGTWIGFMRPEVSPGDFAGCHSP